MKVFAVFLLGSSSFLMAGNLLAEEPVAGKATAATSAAPAKSAAANPGKPVAAKASAEKSSSSAQTSIGINITGNVEAPKVLYILPWKSAEQDVAQPYISGVVDEVYEPIDPVEFERSVQWHELGLKQAAAAEAQPGVQH